MALSPFRVAFVMAHAHSKLIGSHVDNIPLVNIYDPEERLPICRNDWIPVVALISLGEDSHILGDKGLPWLEIPQRKGDITIFLKLCNIKLGRCQVGRLLGET